MNLVYRCHIVAAETVILIVNCWTALTLSPRSLQASNCKILLLQSESPSEILKSGTVNFCRKISLAKRDFSGVAGKIIFLCVGVTPAILTVSLAHLILAFRDCHDYLAGSCVYDI